MVVLLVTFNGWFGLVEGKTLKSYNLTSTIDRHIKSLCGGRWLRRSVIIVQSKIQVTPTQVELELTL